MTDHAIYALMSSQSPDVWSVALLCVSAIIVWCLQ